MKTRILTAAVLVPILLILVLAAPKWITAVIFAAMMAIASYELLYCTGLLRHTRLVIYSSVCAFAITLWSFFGAVHAVGMLILVAFCMAMFAEIMADHVKVRFEKIMICLMAGAVIPYLLSSLIRIHTLKLGRYMIMIPFVVAFLSDAGAYFVGIKYGRRKLAPVISPNKTVEGVIGGLATSMLGMLIYGAVLQFGFKFHVNYGLAVLYSLAGTAIDVFGDLCFSAIKRQTGIKDYGNLMPGHGGVLDRFDSMVFVGPLMEALITLLPMAVAV